MPDLALVARFFDDRVKTSAAEVLIGMIRGLIEGSVLLAGWLLGAKVGFRYYNSCVWHQYYFAVDF